MLRTGWDASLPCVCDDSKRLLNCLGTQKDLPPASDSIEWVPAERSPSYSAYTNHTAKCLKPASHQGKANATKAYVQLRGRWFAF